MSDIKWAPVIIVGIIALFIGGILIYILVPKETTGLSDTEIDAKIAEAVEQAGAVKNTEIERLKGLIGQTENKTTEEDEEEIILFEGYLLDELFLNEPFVKDIFSDREVKTLFDGKVDFDGKTYDAEETLTIKDITLTANGNDFEGNVFMTISRGAIVYKFTFENDLNVSEIEEDETLEFNFLGERYEISEWDTDKIVLTKGEEFALILNDESDTITVDNKTVTLAYVTDDAAYIEVDGVGRSIDEEKTRTVNGLKIKVKDVFASETYNIVVIVIGEEIEAELQNGDEYEEDSAWEYVIDEHSIGIILIEDFTEVDLDDEEEFQAIGTDETLCLPNEYVCIKFNGITEDDAEEYRFELDMKSGNEYVRVNGNFISGIKDYDRLYINMTTDTIYDRDLVALTEPVELADTDSFLTVDNDYIYIKDFTVNKNLNSSKANAIVLDSKDEDWLSNFGLLIVNPEDSAEDNEFSIFVPEERLEGSITILGFGETTEEETTEEPVCDVDNLKLCLDGTTCTDAKGYWYNGVCNVEEASSE